jgi:ubiquinone/menaquinone biosynthesis C-methylase UbiE
MKDHPFQCLRCGNTALERGPDAYRCLSCGAAYPILFDVPLFLNGVRVTPSGYQLPLETAREICRTKGVPEEDGKLQALQQILAYNYDLPDLHLAAENNYLLNRFPLPDDAKRPPVAADRDRVPVNRDVRYRIAGHFLPDALPRDAVLTRNVRLENVGASIISSKVPNPVRLSYHWRTPAGALVVFDGERTMLPIDLLPGRALTVPTLIRTPPAPGPYVLQLLLVHEGESWLEGDSSSVGVDVVPGYRPTTPAHWAKVKQEKYDYMEDHVRGRDRLHAEVRRRHRPGMRLLEVGGCCNPMARGLDADVYSVDIDVQTLQFGQVLVAEPGERLYFVAADANDLPFADHSFDGAAMFSALHHFTDPGAVLAGLKRLLKRDSFLAIMCEPVGAYLNGEVFPEFLRELEQGISEQMFTLEEYHHLFRRAGLYTAWATVDGASFKAILQAEPPRPAAEGVAPPLTEPARRNWARVWNGLRRRLRRSA